MRNDPLPLGEDILILKLNASTENKAGHEGGWRIRLFIAGRLIVP